MILDRFKPRSKSLSTPDLKKLLNKIMSQLADLKGTLDTATTALNATQTKLVAIDTALKALVSSIGNSNVTLDGPTQASLDTLVAAVGTVGTEADTITADEAPAAPTAP